MRRLIVNADDFGYTRGVNRAIVDAHRGGIVTSTSLMATGLASEMTNGAAFEDAVELAMSSPGLDIGCHLNLVEGVPVSSAARVPHLVDSDGKFLGLRRLGARLIFGAVPLAELETECRSQVERILESGLRTSHLDTHQHTHLHPRVLLAVARTARRYRIPWVRRAMENCPPPGGSGPWKRRMIAKATQMLAPAFTRMMEAHELLAPDGFTGFILTGRQTQEALDATLARVPEGITELMCHPGYMDADLQSSATSLREQRVREFELVASPARKLLLEKLGVSLTSFRDLTPSPAWAEETSPLASPAATGK